MALFSTAQPSIRARLLPRFPAQVLAGTGITISKNGGTYVFSATPSNLPLSVLAPIAAGTLVGRPPGMGAGVPIAVAAGLGLTFAGNVIQTSISQRTRALNAVFITPTAGAEQDFSISVACTIRRVALFANAAGSAVVDLWKTTFAGFPPTVANSICSAVGATKPTLATAAKVEDTTLNLWNTTVNAGDVFRVHIDSLTGITRLTVVVDAEIL